MTGKKFSSPQGTATTSGLSSWADCALLCQATRTCVSWTWDISASSCTTISSASGMEDDTNVISGARNCSARTETAGWVTCSATNPYDGATGGSHEVR